MKQRNRNIELKTAYWFMIHTSNTHDIGYKSIHCTWSEIEVEMFVCNSNIVAYTNTDTLLWNKLLIKLTLWSERGRFMQSTFRGNGGKKLHLVVFVMIHEYLCKSENDFELKS